MHRKLLGHDIADTARIGFAFVAAKTCRLGPRSRIGHFTIIRNLDHIELGAGAKIGTFNWIFGVRPGDNGHFVDNPTRISALVMGQESSLTSRHIVDCTDRITIGAFSTIAGYRSQILTHSIDLQNNLQTAEPVIIGTYCMLGTACVVLKGSQIPNGTVLAAGSVFRGVGAQEYHLMSGVPAQSVKLLDSRYKYFSRTSGPVN